MKKYHFCLLLLAVLTNCSKDKNKLVEKELEVYVDRFFEEAVRRDIDISDDNLEVVFRDLTDEGICGLGYFKYLGTELRKVEISPDFFCWGFHDDLARENLVFHELGHAILRRKHENGFMPNGLPEQMMCDGNICDVFSYYDKYTLGKRPYYLDKLFRLSTTTPDWGRMKLKETVYFQENLEAENVVGTIETPSDNLTSEIIRHPITQSKSIALTNTELSESGTVGGWVIQLAEPNIKEGVDLKFSTQVTVEDFNGEGINLILRTYSEKDSVVEISSAASRQITDFTNLVPQLESMLLTYYPSDVQQIEILLQILPNTTGTVYFDDLTLSVMEF